MTVKLASTFTVSSVSKPTKGCWADPEHSHSEQSCCSSHCPRPCVTILSLDHGPDHCITAVTAALFAVTAPLFHSLHHSSHHWITVPKTGPSHCLITVTAPVTRSLSPSMPCSLHCEQCCSSHHCLVTASLPCYYITIPITASLPCSCITAPSLHHCPITKLLHHCPGHFITATSLHC